MSSPRDDAHASRYADEVFSAPFDTQILTRGTHVVRRPDWYQVISPQTQSTSRNEIIHSVIPEARAAEIVDTVLEQYANLNTPFKWCVTPRTRHPGFGKLLAGRGFKSWRARGMHAKIDELDVGFPGDLTFERLNFGNLDDYISAFLNGWIIGRTPTPKEEAELKEDLNWMLGQRGGTAFSLLARLKGIPVGTAGFFLKSKSAYLVGGNVLKSHRGKGIYRGLLAERFRILKDLGVDTVVTHARENTSAPILERLGFETAYRYEIYQYGGTLPE